ncbi:MAG: PfkB family carbohydrate kinase [bacterium]|nr:PfkB family carbohydrate kinase [bacterium]
MITVCSSFSTDKILNEKGKIISIQKGGPALYLTNVFRKENVLFKLISGPSVKVEILLTKKGEIGRVRKIPKPKKTNFEKIKTHFLLISTIYKEFDLSGIFKFQGKIFLDIQGYVRDIKKFGKKKQWKPSKEIISSLFCLKGTKEELKYIPRDMMKKQKKKCLIITKGRSGSIIYYKNKKFVFKPAKIVKVHNTIGVGDTFFANFVLSFIRTNGDIEIAGKTATNEAANFLTQHAK